MYHNILYNFILRLISSGSQAGNAKYTCIYAYSEGIDVVIVCIGFSFGPSEDLFSQFTAAAYEALREDGVVSFQGIVLVANSN